MSHIVFNPVDANTVVPTSAAEPAGAFDFAGTEIDNNTSGEGSIVYTSGTYTLATDTLDIDLVRVSWGLNTDLNNLINFALYADDVVVRSGVIDREDLRSGSVVLTAAEVGAGVLMKLWCSDTDQTALNLLELGSYISMEALASS